jgi:exopolyphosphatase/guanosine-5'-triphosphate,3'-diphosphate pyrophosphatase
MNQNVGIFTEQQRTTGEPFQQLFPVGSVQDPVQGVSRLGDANAFRAGQEMEIMIPQDNRHRISELFGPAQNVDRRRSSVDQITNEPEPVTAGVEVDPAEEPREGVETSLNVADCVCCHVRSNIIRLRDRTMDNEPVADTYVAVDLGSNSFHLKIARMVEDKLDIVDRLRDQVQLAAGLDKHKNLTDEAQARALETLERFGERIRDLPSDHVRAVGTNTLRRARNAGAFIDRAVEALGQNIEIISGQEEARLIYLGVSQMLSDDKGRRLVVDIGGGSTECIVGEAFEPLQAASLYMGCVSYSREFFPEDVIDDEAMRRAETAALVELETIVRQFRTLGWQSSVGSSGTILAIERILRENGWSLEGITPKGLRKLNKAVLQAGHIDALSMPGLEKARAPVLPGGLAILRAIFDSLGIKRMVPSFGALREGVLFDLVGRSRHEDIRDRTVEQFVSHYHVDRAQAERVEQTAVDCLDQVKEAWELTNPEHQKLLVWAAHLHEIGLTISYSGYHRHGEYLIANSEMPGFSRNDQQLLAALVRNHRRKLARDTFEKFRKVSAIQAIRLCVLLRLAVLLNRGRGPQSLPPFKLHAEGEKLEVYFPQEWLDEHPLTRADLEEESTLLKKRGIELWVR